MVRARRLSQLLFLLLFLFLFLQTEQKGADTLGYPAKLFLDFDPLLLVATALSSRALPAAALLLSLLVLAGTLVMGRGFCGWVCPLGTIHHAAGWFAFRKRRPHTHGRDWFRFKYYLLAGLLVSSLFGMQVVGALDPLSLLVRSLALSVQPGAEHAVDAAVSAAYATGWGWAGSAAAGVLAFLKATVLSFAPPRFEQGLLIGVLFLGLLALNWVEPRFWCRHLCPLGALLGLGARFAPFKRVAGAACNGCGACDYACPAGAQPGDPAQWRPSECYLCFNCQPACPQAAVAFGFTAKAAPRGLDLSRRRLLGAAVAGAGAVALGRVTPWADEGRPDPDLIRPPGSRGEDDFLARCVKCGECMKVCTTNGLQPTLLEAGLEGAWSPRLVPRVGYCEYRCTLCGQVCPTGAIRKLSLEEKLETKIGLAFVDRSLCLPWAHAVPCIVCEEVCPTAKKAIYLEDEVVRDREGREVPVRKPKVDFALCVGCGICETKCPVVGRPAIKVLSIGESRNPENQLLLDAAAGPYG